MEAAVERRIGRCTTTPKGKFSESFSSIHQAVEEELWPRCGGGHMYIQTDRGCLQTSSASKNYIQNKLI